uniref:Uncharacterized protein n=1 Tax=Anguilla anguilla TaxID=7936 RepID=A0A0E9Q2K5_ANGAN
MKDSKIISMVQLLPVQENGVAQNGKCKTDIWTSRTAINHEYPTP